MKHVKSLSTIILLIALAPCVRALDFGCASYPWYDINYCMTKGMVAGTNNPCTFWWVTNICGISFSGASCYTCVPASGKGSDDVPHSGQQGASGDIFKFQATTNGVSIIRILTTGQSGGQ